ncbi:MAG: TldD/PmbA family protein [Amaricoccus sp.]
MLSENDSEAICDKLLRLTKADDAAVIVESEDRSHLRFAANGVTTSGRREDASAKITVWLDSRRGSATANDLDDAALARAVAEAEQLARLSPPDDEYLPTLGPQQYAPAAGYVEATANPSPADRARAVDAILQACDKAGVVGAGFHQSSGTTVARATRNGNFGYRRSSLVSLSVTARAADGGSSGYFLRNHFDVAKLDTERIGNAAIDKALASRNPRSLDPGVYPTILEPQAADDLIRFAFDARSADEGRSPFSAPDGRTRLGEPIFDPRLSVSSDPWHPDLPGSPWTPEGLPARRIWFVRRGVLENLRYSRYWASRKGEVPTPGPVNTILEGDAPGASIEEMIAATPRGLLVTRFWYIRPVDPRTALFTGVTRDGLWYIEDGRIRYPVMNFRFNQSVLDLLAPGNVELVGTSERTSDSDSQGENASLMPALKVSRFNFTSLSEAV